MSHTLESMAVEDQVSTPTPGSPRPYITAESHDRLDSIQLSSDASGEFITTHSPRSFLGPPGEALSELRNALNPPWLHGPTGTPPSLVGLYRGNRDGRWVDGALRLVDQPAVDVLPTSELALLSLGRGLISSGDITHLPSVQPSMPLSHVNALPKAQLDKASTSPLPHTSPFDKPVDSAKRADKSDGRAIDHAVRQGKQAFNPQDVRSGDASSEEGEAWAMPETPFLASDVWASTTAPGEHGKQGQPRTVIAIKPQRHTPSAPEAPKATSDHRKATGGGGRGQGLISLHRAKEGERRVGRCKMYNCDKGVGFLIDDRLDEVPYDVKIHWTDLYSDQEFKSLAKGEIVEYTLNITTNGYSASYVTGPGGRPVMGAEQTIVQASRQTSYKLFKAGALPVKTYKSKWDDVPSPGLTDSSPLASGNPAAARSPVNPRGNQALPADSRIAMHSANHGLSQHHLAGQGRTIGGHSPVAQLTTPLWAPLRSPVNVINTHGTLMSGLPGSHTPMPGLSHSALTPHSVESYNSVLLGGYTPNQLQSVRSSAVQIATPGDHANPFLANRLLHHANAPIHHHDLQSLLAERQMLLQHQAALMNLYQNAGQPTSAAAIQTLNQLSAQNSVKKNMAANEAQFYGGLYNRASGLLDPQSQFLGLLPPIALPTNKEPYNPMLKHNDAVRNRVAGAWRSPEFIELKIDPAVASLRPNAEAFTPSAIEALSFIGLPPSQGYRDGRNANPQDPGRRADGQVYQVPGRRTVSDSTSAPASVTKKHGALANPHVRLSNPPHAVNAGLAKHVSEKATSSKRVTFAEQSTPSRRAVSYGEAPTAGAPGDRSPSLEGDGEESSELHVPGAQSLSPIRRSSMDQYALEESRRVGDVKSVEIAMERLREAAAPRRLSLRNTQNHRNSPDIVEATRSELLDQDKATEKSLPGRASSAPDPAAVRPDFSLSIVEGIQAPAQLAA